jgi:hypothetical protein
MSSRIVELRAIGTEMARSSVWVRARPCYANKKKQQRRLSYWLKFKNGTTTLHANLVYMYTHFFKLIFLHSVVSLTNRAILLLPNKCETKQRTIQHDSLLSWVRSLHTARQDKNRRHKRKQNRVVWVSILCFTEIGNFFILSKNTSKCKVIRGIETYWTLILKTQILRCWYKERSFEIRELAKRFSCTLWHYTAHEVLRKATPFSNSKHTNYYHEISYIRYAIEGHTNILLFNFIHLV